MPSIPLRDRFWKKVERGAEDDCWNWTASRRPAGYGSVYGDGQIWDTHKAAWVLTYGPVPDGLCVLHKCDNRACCNPKHLFLGTKADNMRDMHAKGRYVSTRGQETGSKLTPAQVKEIRSLRRSARLSYRGIGQRFGVSGRCVCDIFAGRTWSWLKDA